MLGGRQVDTRVMMPAHERGQLGLVPGQPAVLPGVLAASEHPSTCADAASVLMKNKKRPRRGGAFWLTRAGCYSRSRKNDQRMSSPEARLT